MRPSHCRVSSGPFKRVSTALLLRLHCQHSKVVSATGMFCTTLHVWQRTACIPGGVFGTPFGSTATMTIPIGPSNAPSKNEPNAPRSLAWPIASCSDNTADRQGRDNQ